MRPAFLDLFRLGHDFVDDLPARLHSLDAAAALTGGEAVVVRVAFGHFREQESHQALPVHELGLVRKRLDVLRVLFPLLGRRVTQGPQGFARPAAGNDRVAFARLDDGILVDLGRAGLLRGDKPRADPYAFAAEGQGRRQAATVEDSAGRHDGDGNRIDRLGQQSESADRTGVSARFGALSDDQVATGLGRHPRVLHGGRHRDDLQARLVAHAHHPARHAQPGGEARGTAVDDPLHLFDRVVVDGVQQIDAERLFRELADAG